MKATGSTGYLPELIIEMGVSIYCIYAHTLSTHFIIHFLEVCTVMPLSIRSLDFTECPLTLAAQLEGCAELIKVLKSGGAHLDFRTKDGITALHKAVRSKNHTALIVSITNTYNHTRKLTHLFLFLLL